MPTFDFHCTACDTTFEKTLPFGSKGKPACPHCKSKKTEKLISMPGIAFKGTGFYKTDSQKKPIAVTPPAEKKAEKASEAKPEKTAPNEAKEANAPKEPKAKS